MKIFHHLIFLKDLFEQKNDPLLFDQESVNK